MGLACEICREPVRDAGSHHRVTSDRPDGYWLCHKNLGRCRCAKCDHVWRPRAIKLPSRCPSCGEDSDLFWADDGGWERAAKERSARRSDADYE